MSLRARFLSFVLITPALTLHAQTQPATPKTPPDVVAGIPVNYDEAKVGTYVLPDPLKLDNGKPVRDAATWYSKRRPEIVEMFETQQYGRAPGRPPGESFEVVDKGTPALNGKAIRKQVTIYLNKDKQDKTGPSIDLLIYLPAAAHKPVPMLLSINFGAVQNAVDDPGIKPETVWDPKTNTRIAPSSGHNFGHIDAEALIDAGIGVATFYYGDVDPDYPAGFSNGIRARYLKPGQTERAPDEWGTISAWAWGMSRVEDYFETDKSIDAKRVAIHGISRLGKTVMWAGAHDQRFAAVIESCSGEGGAALSHRDYGETIAHLTAPSRYPYQFAANYAKYGGFPDKAPMDANLLIALIAPRPLLLQTGNTDYWSDPKGEFLAAVAAGPVYKLLGKEDLGTDIWPSAKQPIFHDLSYCMHDGGHGMVPSDWQIYIEFLKKTLHPEQ
ncbi:glucuronyl esterase domain-containing protein [Tunturiibacter lichenicola]|uniref:glucuronyl esterase domain-containing protein n=1 Tax=Tunturiibacter lichenicola TaxID=2051959 RepID=UPI0021B2EFAA|nr:acetylxylan esterase [Edaphobacter lichenicola]